MGHAAAFQRAVQGRPLQRRADHAQGQVVFAEPVEGGREIRRHLRVQLDVVVVVPRGQVVAGQRAVIDVEEPRLAVHIIDDGIGQQQRAGLGQAVVFVPHPVGAEHPAQVPPGRKAHQGVLVRPDPELPRMGRDVLHRPDQVVVVAVFGHLMPRPVLQDKGGVAHFVQLADRAAGLLGAGGALQHVAGQDQGVLPVGAFPREIVELHPFPGGVGGDLLRRVEGVGHLQAPVVVVDDQVQPRHRVVHSGADEAAQGPVAVLPGLLGEQGAPVPGVEARARDPLVGAHLCHRGVRGDRGRGQGPGGDGQQGGQRRRSQDGGRRLFCVHIVPFPLSVQAVTASQKLTASYSQPAASVPAPLPLPWGALS